MKPTAPDFDVIDDLVRERDIEGEIGVWLKVTDSVYLNVLAQTDANPRYRQVGPKRYRELKRQANAKATPEELDAGWAAYWTDCHIIGWEGVITKAERDNESKIISGGEPVPFTRTNCIAWLLKHTRLFRVLDRYTEDETNFRRAAHQEVVDEAKKSSSGIATTDQS